MPKKNQQRRTLYADIAHAIFVIQPTVIPTPITVDIHPGGWVTIEDNQHENLRYQPEMIIEIKKAVRIWIKQQGFVINALVLSSDKAVGKKISC